MPQTKPAINLYEKIPLEQQATKSKFLGWMGTFGKIIIIGVNFVTIGAFAFRVVVDQKIFDLRERVAVQEKVLLASKDFESDFRSLQEKTTLLKDFSSPSILMERLELVEQSMPWSVVSQSFVLDSQTVLVGAVSYDGAALSVLSGNLLNKGAKDFTLKEARFGSEGFEVAFQISF